MEMMKIVQAVLVALAIRPKDKAYRYVKYKQL
jgi:hypothetical protein